MSQAAPRNDDRNPILVELTRGEIVESVHRGALAVSDAAGRILIQLGDIETPVYPRSAFKMMQALPLIETGAADAFKVTPKELAMACASHSSEAFHVKTVARWLKRIGCGEGDLACGPHLPMNEAAARALQRGRKEPTRLHNNCSGKHSGFLCTACHMGEPIADYVDVDHPVQRRVRQAIADLCDVAADSMPWGIDGCAAPNFALPLKNLALGFARLADPSGLASARAAAAVRLVQAVRENPLYESGTGRSDVALIEATTGGTVTKIGAEGVYSASIPALGLGVALKIDDGAGRAAETAIAAVLARLGVLDVKTDAARPLLVAPIVNWRGDHCGERRPADALKTL
jgi:L-asparaginase II